MKTHHVNQATRVRRRPWLPAPGIFAMGLVLAAAQAGAQPAAPNPSFNLVNRSSEPIKELYFTGAGDANWGRNRLEGQTIGAGKTYAARRRADGQCIFDVRVVFADGLTEDRRGLNTCNVDDVAFGAPGGGQIAGRKAPDDPSFKLANHGATPILELYAAQVGTGNWGTNRLTTPLAPQTDRRIEIPSHTGCSFDLRVVFDGGRKMERHRADLCKVTSLPVP